MSEEPTGGELADDDEPSRLAVEDVELTPGTVRWYRAALLFLGAATAVALVGLGSDGRASGVLGALDAGADRIIEQADKVVDGVRYELQAIADAERASRPGIVGPVGSYSTVIVVEDSGGSAASIVLAVADPNGSSILVVFPPSLSVTVPGYGNFSLGQTALFEDAALTALTLSNELGVRVDTTIAITFDELAQAVATPLTVDLPTEVIVPSAGGGTILADAGESSLQPSVVATIMITQGESDVLAWLERQGAVWEAIFNSDDVLGFINAIEGRAGPGEDGALTLRAVAGGSPLTVGSPTYSSIGIGDDEQLALRGNDADEFVAARMAHLLIRPDGRPRVEVLNGNGQTQTTRLVAETLVRRGFRVIRTDNADSFGYEDSRVIAQGRGNRLPGAEIVQLLGVGQLELEIRAPSGVVDVSIIVGQDIPIGEGS